MIELLKAKDDIYWENPYDGEEPFCTKGRWYKVIKYTDYTVIFENDLGMPHNWNIDEVDEYFWTIDFEKGFEVENSKGSELVFRDNKFHNITAGIYDLTVDNISKKLYKDFIMDGEFTVTKYSNQQAVKPFKEERPYENWKMTISRDKFARCINDRRVFHWQYVEGILGFLNKDENMFYYSDAPNKYIAAKVYPFKYPDDSEGWEFVKENCDSLQKSIVPKVNNYLVSRPSEKSDILEALESTKNGILASFGVPKKMLGNYNYECVQTYNPVKNISLEKYQRCVDKAIEQINYFNQSGELTWMFKSPCENYYYWCDYNSKNDIIYFRGEVDWVEKNYRKDNPEQREKLAELAEKLRGYYDEKDPVIVSSESCEGIKTEWTDKHYDFNYTLTEDDIEKGVIKIDPYFVNRMWKINSWDDTGAAFHSLKNYARISNGKNPLERDLTSLYKQVKRLCELHGVKL